MRLIRFDTTTCRVGAGVMLYALLVGVPSQGSAQQPVPASTPPSSSASAYRPPVLVLVQPAAGGSVPEDKPVVVFRLAPGEPNDPIDARSFAVVVDGVDRTAQFRIAAEEAWGSLADPKKDRLSRGPHQLAARICSARGACTEVSAMVAVVEASVARGETAEAAPDARRRKILDAVITAIRNLLDL